MHVYQRLLRVYFYQQSVLTCADFQEILTGKQLGS